MAISITINLDDELEAALVRATNEFNLANPGSSLTPTQMLRQRDRDWLRSLIAQWNENEQLGLRAAYKAAPESVQDQIDTLLEPYR